MERVRISQAAVAHPETRIDQEEAVRRVSCVVGSERRVRALARGTQILGRNIVLPADEMGRLGSIEERNAIYELHAPELATRAARGLGGCLDDVSFLVTSSCTGYMVPGLDVHLAQALALRPGAARLPVTEAGCAGGVVALARAADYLRVSPGTALVVAAELCSLAFHPDDEEGNLTSALLFADGAGAVLLDSGEEEGEGLEIVDGASMLVPCSRDVLGFNLTNAGFYPLLARRLVQMLPVPTRVALDGLLARNGLDRDDIAYWLVHPGGPRILEALQQELSVEAERLRWSWDALRCSGNTSSAAITEVLARYLADPAAPGGWGVMLAFGPGVSIEMLLVHR